MSHHYCVRKPSRLSSPLAYVCCRNLAWLIFRCLCRIHVVVLETPPKKGPLILASNHISHFDPALLSAVFPRIIDWVAMEELAHHSWGARFFSYLNTIFVDRSGNRSHQSVSTNHQSLRIMLKRLASKRTLGIFPEGGIRSGASSILERAPMKPGLTSLSFAAQAPIIPCVVLGCDRLYFAKNWLRRPSLWIIIGKPILPPKPTTTDRKEALHIFQQQLNAAFPALQEELCKRFLIS